MEAIDLFREHENYVKRIACRFRTKLIAPEDRVQIALLSLWRAASKFDRDKGKAKSFIYIVVIHALISAMRRQQTHAPINTIYLDDVIPGKVTTYHDVIPDRRPSDIEAILDAKAAVEESENPAPRKWGGKTQVDRQEVLRLYALGWSGARIGRALGVCRERIRQILIEARRP